MRIELKFFCFVLLCAQAALADPNKVMFDAIESGDHFKIKAALDRGANVKAKNDHGESVLHVCSRVGDGVMMAEFVSLGANVNVLNALGQTALQVAAAYGHEQEVRMLVLLNADVLFVDRDGLSATDLAAQNEEWELVEYLSKETEKARRRRPVEVPQARFQIPGIIFPIGIIVIAGVSAVLGKQ